MARSRTRARSSALQSRGRGRSPTNRPLSEDTPFSPPPRWPRSEALLATRYSTMVLSATKHEAHGHRCTPLFSAEGTQLNSRHASERFAREAAGSDRGGSSALKGLRWSRTGTNRPPSEGTLRAPPSRGPRGSEQPLAARLFNHGAFSTSEERSPCRRQRFPERTPSPRRSQAQLGDDSRPR
jgi:hypothetical protein